MQPHVALLSSNSIDGGQQSSVVHVHADEQARLARAVPEVGEAGGGSGGAPKRQVSRC